MRLLSFILCAASAPILLSGCGFRKVNPTTACFVYVVTSDSHTCARKTDGTLWCWGNNQYGQLTGSDAGPQLAPIPVTSLGGTVARIYLPSAVGTISSRTAFTCVRRTDASLWCWGNNEHGQLGTGDNATRRMPVSVAPQVIGNALDAVSSGAGFACARKTDGTLWCWGSNAYGQLGTGGTAPSAVPVQVDPRGLGAEVAQIYAGESHVCAVKTDGTLWCWGNNAYGQLGTGDTRPRSAPAQVDPQGMGAGVAVVFAGANHTCAVMTDSTLWCWGNNQFGQLGVGDQRTRLSPARVDFADVGPGVSVVTAGGNHTCAAKTDGTLWCWGNNQYGQLGSGQAGGSATPVSVDLPAAVSVVYAGGTHTCARTTDSALWCWGSNQYGQLGIAAGASSNVPMRIAPSCP
jgi:alpha-tubulin suppressor-like RCC1 family protein